MKRRVSEIAQATGYSLLCVALASATMLPAIAIADESSASSKSAESSTSTQTSVTQAEPQAPSSKDETVYVYTTADGTVKNEEVKATLSNPDGAKALSDASILESIKADDDSNTFTGSTREMTWSTNGKDVTYKGETSALTPVDVRVSYKLDGKTVSANELAGKTGHVVIRYDYENNSRTTVNVNGVDQEVYTPFFAVTALLLDRNVFSNIEVTNGKVIDDGDRTVVVGYAMPGLSDSLNMSSNDIDIPGYFELEADAKSFELNSTLTVVSPNLFDDMNLDFDTGELSSASSSLRDAMSQVVSGSGELADAANEIADYARTMADGASALSSQASALPSSASQLSTGAQGVSAGVEKLYAAAKELDAKLLGAINGSDSGGTHTAGLVDMKQTSTQLVALSEQLYKDLGGTTDTMSTQAVTDKNAELSALAVQVVNEASAFDANVQNMRSSADQTAQQATQAIDSLDAAQTSLDSIDLSAIEDDAVRTQIQSQIDAAKGGVSTATASVQSVEAQAHGLQNTAYAGSLDATQQAISTFGEASDAQLSAQDIPDAQVATAKEEAKKLYESLVAFDAGLGMAIDGLSALEQQGFAKGLLADDAFPAVLTGAQQVAAGNAALSNQAPALVQGTSQLASGSDSLAAAIQALASGSEKLTEGLQEFSDQGISKVADSIDNDLVAPLNRFDAVVQAGREYNNFSGLPTGSKGSVKFVYETDAIE